MQVRSGTGRVSHTNDIAADVLHVHEDVDLAGGHITQHGHARKRR